VNVYHRDPGGAGARDARWPPAAHSNEVTARPRKRLSDLQSQPWVLEPLSWPSP